MPIERRFTKGAEVRASEAVAAKTPQIEGYAAVFNEEFCMYEDNDFRVVEIIKPGAFSPVLSNDVRCLFNHAPDHVLGRSTNGTLRMTQDDKGLAYTNDMDSETRIGRDVYQFVKRGDVTGCSFAFIVDTDEWTEAEKDGRTVFTRTINQMRQLFDVGPVTYPAYEQTVVDARKLATQLELRSGPFSGMPEALAKRIEAGKEAPGLTAEQKEAYRRYTEIRTSL